VKYDKGRVLSEFTKEQAVVGDCYYGGDCESELEDSIRRGNAAELKNIYTSDYGVSLLPFCFGNYSHLFILPVDAVEKEYRPFKENDDLLPLLGKRIVDNGTDGEFVGYSVDIMNGKRKILLEIKTDFGLMYKRSPSYMLEFVTMDGKPFGKEEI
jgi:hypothetical protein